MINLCLIDLHIISLVAHVISLVAHLGGWLDVRLVAGP